MELTPTRRSLHGVAELVVAGPQYRERGTICLRPAPGGFAGVAIDLRVEGVMLVDAAAVIAFFAEARRRVAADPTD